MNTNMQDYIVDTNTMDWTALQEKGIDTSGIFVKILRFDHEQQRPPSIMLKFEPGASYPYHNHPGGEEIFVTTGSCLVNDTLLSAGEYLYTPSGFKHAVRTEAGCEMILIAPLEVEILENQ